MSTILPLSSCNRILIFPPQFSDIPRKISAYLQTDSSSGANTRIIRGFYKILNINDLCLRGILLFCKKHHFGLRNGPYWRPKWAISHPNIGFSHAEMGSFGKQNESFRTTLRGISKDGSGQNGLYYIGFNIHLHLFCENILSKFSQEKL